MRPAPSPLAYSKQTLLCTYLSAVLLVGLVLNATLGWSWADPIAALVIAAIAVKEDRDAWLGKGCCAPSSRTRPGSRRGPRGRGGCGCLQTGLPLLLVNISLPTHGSAAWPVDTGRAIEERGHRWSGRSGPGSRPAC
jgi:hypothetical protein